MRRLTLILSVLVFICSATALDAVIQPNPTDSITLDESNNFEVEKEFDASASSPQNDIKSYSWSLVGTDQTGTGPQTNFTFSRENDRSNTVRLVVSNSTASSVAEVTQVLKDQPQTSISASSSSVDIEDGEETVDFTSSVTNSFDGNVSYKWKVEGTQESTSSSFSKTFSSTGDYKVELNVTDNAGLYDTDSLTVSVTNSSSGSNNQQGGGGGSGNSFDWDEAVSYSSISGGETEDFGFDDSPLTNLDITVNSDLNDVEIRSKATEDQPDGLDEAAENQVYRYVRLDKKNITNDDIDEVKFSFEVSRDWINRTDVKRSSIVLERYDGSDWEKLDTSETEEDDSSIYFEAISEGLSYFAITGEKKKASFTVNSLSVSPTEISPGENVTITVEVENTGEVAGDHDLSFELAGIAFEKTVTLDAGSSKTVEFNREITEEGSHTAGIGDKDVSLTVGSVSSQQDSDSGTDPKSETTVQETEKNRQNTQKQGEGGSIVLPLVGFILIVGVLGGGYYLIEEEEIHSLDELLHRVMGEDKTRERETEYDWDSFS